MKAFDILMEALDEAIENESCLGIDEHMFIWQLDPVNGKTLYGLATEEGTAGFFYTFNKYEAMLKALETVRDNHIILAQAQGFEFHPNEAMAIPADNMQVERNSLAEIIEDARKRMKMEEKKQNFKTV